MVMKKNNLKKYCFALDLIDEKDKIDSYIEYHKKVWPEIYNSIRDSGVKKLEIFQIQNRLFMILEASEKFSLDRKADMDANNPIVQKWEKLMWKYQKSIPGLPEGTKWGLMNKIFDLNE